MPNDLIVANPAPLTTRQESVQDRFGASEVLVANQWIPEKLSPSLLPWLAWGMSVDAWSDEWTDEERAAVVRNSIAFHRKKGTLAGMTEAVRLGGGRLIRIVRPPSTFFAAPSLTAEERERFLARYPELRIYKYRNRGTRGAGMFLNRDFLSAADQPSGSRIISAPSVTDAVFRFGERTTIWDRGVETELNSVTRTRETSEGEAVEFTEVRMKGVAIGLFAGVSNPHPFLVDHGSKGRIYQVRAELRYSASQDRLHLNSVKPSLEPIDYDAVPVAERGTRRGFILDASFIGGGVKFGTFLQVSNARDRLYSKLYLFDKTRALEARGRSIHLGAARLSMPHHEAEILVQIRGKENTRSFRRFVAGFFIAADKGKFYNVLRLMNSARPASVKVGVKTKTVSVAVAGKSIKAGQIVAGELRENS